MHGLKAKTLKRMLKKAGLKTSGRKATLTKRARKAHILRGGTTYSLGTNEEWATVPGAPQAGGAFAGEGMPSAATMESAGPVGASYMLNGGRRRHGVSAKALKRMLKKAGLKTSGRKSALTKRAKKAHLVRGGVMSSGNAEQAGLVQPSGVWGQE